VQGRGEENASDWAIAEIIKLQATEPSAGASAVAMITASNFREDYLRNIF
jgi:hypothetical protein